MKKQAITKRQALAGASGMALILGLVNVAVAQTTIDIDISVPSVVIAQPGSPAHSSQTKQEKSTNAAAEIKNTSLSVKNASGDVIVGSDNLISSTAMANDNISTGLIDVLDGVQNFSFAAGQANIGTVKSSISGAPLVEIVFGTNPVGQVTVSGTSAQAQSTVNASLIEVTHTGLDAFEDTAVQGEAKVDVQTKQASAEANGVLATYQKTEDTDSAALVDSAGIVVDVSPGTIGTATSIRIAGNDIRAGFVANDATNHYGVSGAALDLDGSVVIASLQDNRGTHANSTAEVTGSGIDVIAGANAINFPVTVVGNHIEASSTGNIGNNALAMEGLSVHGPSGAAAATGGYGAEVEKVNLGIASAQANLGTSLSSKVADSHIEVTSASTTAGTGRIVLASNTSLAAATGNVVANDIDVVVTDQLEKAGFAIASTQRNYGTQITAENTTNILVRNANPPTGNPGALLHEGRVVLAGNTVGAEARGGMASNMIGVAGDGQSSSAEMVLQNDQLSHGPDGQVSATAGGDIGAVLEGKLNVAVVRNTIESLAITHAASNIIDVDVSGKYRASLTNSQSIQGGSPADTTATTENAHIGVYAPTSIGMTGNSTVSVARNQISAQAGGNEALNAILGDAVTDITLDKNSVLDNVQASNGSVTATADGHIFILGAGQLGTTGEAYLLNNSIVAVAFGNSATNVADLDAGTSLDTGDFKLTSTQTSEGAVLASAKGRMLIGDQDGGNQVGSGLEIDGTAVVKGNELSALAMSNDVQNLIAMNAGTTASGSPEIVNSQTATGDTTATAATGQAGMSIVSQATAGIMGTAVLTENTIASDAIANRAGNVIDIAALTGSTAAPVLGNMQLNEGEVSATTTVEGMGVIAQHDISGTATVSKNTLSAAARANQAANRIALASEEEVSGDAQIDNEQTNRGPVSSSLALRGAQGGLGVKAGSLSGTAVVSSNSLSSVALGSQASNEIELDILNATSAPDAEIDNKQTNEQAGVIISTIDLDAGVGIHSNADIAGTVLTVTGNDIDSLAAANHAENVIDQKMVTGDGFSATAKNDQSNHAGVNAKVAFGQEGSVGVSTFGEMNSSTVNLVDNHVQARAYGNSAINALNGSVTAGALNSTQSVDNTQNNTGAIAATINGATAGWAGRVFDVRVPSGGADNVVRVANNSIAAVAYGNTAVNQVTASSLLGAVTASQSISSSQTNTGNVTASVTNAGMGVMGAGTGNRTIIAGNSISATAVGNASVSTMVIGN
ncbi:MAG: hypothetical protein WCY98_10270 [Castellaniella sp.]